MRTRGTPLLLVLLTALGGTNCTDRSVHTTDPSLHVTNVANATSRTLYDVAQGQVRFRALLLPHSELDLERAESLGRAFITEVGRSPYAELLLAENEEDLRVSHLGTVPRPESESSFDETLAQLKAATGAAGQPTTPIARVLEVNGGRC